MRSLSIAIGLPLASLMMLADGTSSRLSPQLEKHIRNEVGRLQAHFDSVDTELRARDVSHLSPAQRRARIQLVTWLRDYRAGALFPLNDGVSNRAVPIFRDSRGVLCAMAYLIERSGRADIVDDVAAIRNTATIAELADDPRLIAWLDSTGLTLDEAVRIQPEYGPIRAGDRNAVNANYAVASLVLSGTAIATAVVNAVSPSRLSGILGFIAGSAATVNGVTRLDDASGTKRVAGTNTAIGVLAMGVAFRGIINPKAATRPQGASVVRRRDVALAPAVLPMVGRPQVGFVLSARF